LCVLLLVVLCVLLLVVLCVLLLVVLCVLLLVVLCVFLLVVLCVLLLVVLCALFVVVLCVLLLVVLFCIVVSCFVCIVVVDLYVLLSSYVYLLHYVCIAVFTLDAGLLARSQYSEDPVTGHLDTGFSWFPCAQKQMLRWFPRFQVATTCFSCSSPELNLVITNFLFCIRVK